jgi:hypothetical protein
MLLFILISVCFSVFLFDFDIDSFSQASQRGGDQPWRTGGTRWKKTEGDRPSDRWDPPVRTDEKLNRNDPCLGPFGRAPAPPKTAPAPLVERLLRWSWSRFRKRLAKRLHVGFMNRKKR